MCIPKYLRETSTINAYRYVVNLAIIDIILGIKANEKKSGNVFLEMFLAQKKMILSNTENNIN